SCSLNRARISSNEWGHYPCISRTRQLDEIQRGCRGDWRGHSRCREGIQVGALAIGPGAARMSERFALVTGTSSGIGAAVAKELLKRGWQVVGIARRAVKIEDKRYRHVALDLSDIAKAAPKIEREVGAKPAEPWERVGLVNNAAVGLSGRIQDFDVGELARSF